MSTENDTTDKPLPTQGPETSTPTPRPSGTPTDAAPDTVYPQPIPTSGIDPLAPYIVKGEPLPDAVTVYDAPDEATAYAMIADALDCHESAPALDQYSPTSWWGYCEPALWDDPTTDDHDGYSPHVTATATTTPPPDLPSTLAETGPVADGFNPAVPIIGTILVIAGIFALVKDRKPRH